MIYFLYLNKEIFLCELVLNVVDVVDKLCFCVLENDSFYENDGELNVKFSVDKEVNIVIIIDNGIGMICDEVIVNLGIIVKLGIKDFFSKFFGDSVKDL